MSSTQDSIKKTSKLTATCLKALRIALAVAICIQLFFIVSGMLTIGEGQSITEWGSLNFSSVTSNNFLISTFVGTNAEMVTQLTTNILNQSIMIAMLTLASAIFTDISKEYTPFSQKHIKRLQIISLLMVALAIIPPPIEMLLTMILSPSSEASAEYQLILLVFAIIFYCLSQIFEYGRMLQKQSDEML